MVRSNTTEVSSEHSLPSQRKKEEGSRIPRYFVNYYYSLLIYRGLYGGMPVHLLRSVPNAAIMFVTFELVNQMLEKATHSLEK